MLRIPVVVTGTAALAMGIHWYARSAPRMTTTVFSIDSVPPTTPTTERSTLRDEPHGGTVAAEPHRAVQPRATSLAPVALAFVPTAVPTSRSPLSLRGDDSIAAVPPDPSDTIVAAAPDSGLAHATVGGTRDSSSGSMPPAADLSAFRHGDGTVPPFVTATALTPPIMIDGRLDDTAWAEAKPLTGLLQIDPDEGRPGSESTTVRVVFDADAIYIGARLYDATPSGIVRRLGRRDASTHSDQFEVLLDTYHDHRTAFRFAVNAAGIKTDELIGDDGAYGDDSWDPIWEAATSIDSLGWSAEMRIPFSQLRFSPRQQQVWGIRFVRWIERKNERDMFPFVPKTQPGEASRFAHLIGLGDIAASPKRGELLPFVVTRGTYHRPSAARNPFDGSSRYFGSGGVDVKYGLSPSLTLDGTVNPDFGQVELDPAVVNLTQYETFLQERRPFFVEGGQLFGFGGTGGGVNRFSDQPLYFYSRRIGDQPAGSATSEGQFVDMPASTTILGAAKLTGRVTRRWSIGVLDAVTAREWATVVDTTTGARFHDEVQPSTNYFAGRVLGDFQGGNTTVGLITTAVDRSLGTPALAFLSRGAYAGGLDLFHRWGHNTYTLAASVGGSYITGDTVAIQQAQLSSDRYYQRPDAAHFRFDPLRRSLSGVSADLYVNKIAGNWNWGIAGSTVSPGFEVNDFGFQERVDLVSLSIAAGRWWTRSRKTFRKAYAFVKFAPSWNYDGDPIQRKYSAFAYGQFRNFWSLNMNANYSAAVLDDRLTRGGPLARKPASWSASADVYNDTRKQVSGYAYVAYNHDAAGGWNLTVLPLLTLRRSAAVSLSLGPEYIVGRASAQYLETVPDSLAKATGGSRYVFGELLQHSLDVTLRVNAAFSPTLSFQLYAQPFTFSGSYRGFKELRASRTYDFNVYGRDDGSTIRDTMLPSGTSTVPGYAVSPGGGAETFTFANPDFRTRSLQFKGVLRWEYRPGSTLYLAWTQSRSGYFPSDGSFSLGRDLGDQLFHDRPTNVLLVKVNYWMSW